jgi:hypothetical protein
MIMGTIGVHEFITMDGVMEDPSWPFDYSFDPKMSETIAGIIGIEQGDSAGAPHLPGFRPVLVCQNCRRRPRRAVHERDAQVCRLRLAAAAGIGAPGAWPAPLPQAEAGRQLTTLRPQRGCTLPFRLAFRKT